MIQQTDAGYVIAADADENDVSRRNLVMPQTSYEVIAFAGANLPLRYQGLVYSRWLLGLRYGNEYYRLTSARSYFDHYHAFLTRLINQRGTIVRLAVLSDDHDVALGFSVARGRLLDFVHVQRDMRNQGIGSKLVPGDIEAITHLTKAGKAIWQTKYPQWYFDPFI
jgi:GNAT superfamily N-acetyltransferase